MICLPSGCVQPILRTSDSFTMKLMPDVGEQAPGEVAALLQLEAQHRHDDPHRQRMFSSVERLHRAGFGLHLRHEDARARHRSSPASCDTPSTLLFCWQLLADGVHLLDGRARRECSRPDGSPSGSPAICWTRSASARPSGACRRSPPAEMVNCRSTRPFAQPQSCPCRRAACR